MVILYDKQLGDTIIVGNTDISGNIIIEIRDLVPSFLHIGLHTGVQNIVSNQSRQKLSQIPPFKKKLKGLILIQFCRLLMTKEQFAYP